MKKVLVRVILDKDYEDLSNEYDFDIEDYAQAVKLTGEYEIEYLSDYFKLLDAISNVCIYTDYYFFKENRIDIHLFEEE